MQKELNSISYGFQHWFFIDFGVIWEVFFHDFWSAFRVSSKRERSHSFSNIFQRFSYFVAIAKSLKSIIKMGGFWTMDFVIHIMRWSKTSSKNHIKNNAKIIENLIKKGSESNTMSDSLFTATLGPFWLHFGPILDPTSLRIASGRQKILLGTPLENHSVFGSVSGGARSWGYRGSLVVIAGGWAPLIH